MKFVTSQERQMDLKESVACTIPDKLQNAGGNDSIDTAIKATVRLPVGHFFGIIYHGPAL